mgnify:CR=1 FL=1
MPETNCQGLFNHFHKEVHFAYFLTKHTLDFVLHRLLSGFAEMDMDDIGGLSDFLLTVGQSLGFGIFAVLVIQNPPVNEKCPVTVHHRAVSI